MDIFIVVVKENFEVIGVEFQFEVFVDFNLFVFKVESGDYDVVLFFILMLIDFLDGF